MQQMCIGLLICIRAYKYAYARRVHSNVRACENLPIYLAFVLGCTLIIAGYFRDKRTQWKATCVMYLCRKRRPTRRLSANDSK